MITDESVPTYTLEPVEELVRQEILDLKEYPLTELQERIIDYLLDKVEDLVVELEVL